MGDCLLSNFDLAKLHFDRSDIIRNFKIIYARNFLRCCVQPGQSLGVLSCPVVRAKSGKERAREVLGVYLSVTSQLTVESRIDRAENAEGLGCC